MATPINITFVAGTLEPGKEYNLQELFNAFAENLLGTVNSDVLMPGVASPSAPSVDRGIWLNTGTSPHSIMLWDSTSGGYVRDDSQTPIGAVMFWPGSAAIPSNYRQCAGGALSKTTYAKCYQALGGSSSPYGESGSTFFLPNSSGRTLFGLKGGWSIGDTFGVESIRLKENNLPAHTHDLKGHKNRDGAEEVPGAIVDDGRHTVTTTDYGAVIGGGNGSSQGDAFSVLNPGLVGRWIIRVQ